MTIIQAADLFCGAGGTSSGLYEAAAELGLTVDLVAVNHWEVAIATHGANHPAARHYCAGIENLDPRKAVPGGALKLLVASPECIYHSKARGGKPINDQLRVSPWDILRWLEALYVENVIVENVPEFRNWGPLDDKGQPIKKLRGKTFLQYLKTLRSLGYFVDWRVLNAANYGDPTTRERLFVIARRGHRVHWPEATHAREPQTDLAGRTLELWRTAREIIDWTIPGQSIYRRKRPLKASTLRRIEAGLRKFCGLPFVLGQQSCAAPRSVSEPVPTVATAGAISLIQPFLIQFNGTRDGQLDGASARSVDAPVPTITAEGEHIGLVQPFVLSIRGGQDGYLRASSIDAPLPTVTTVNPHYLVQPFLVEYHGANRENGERVRSIDQPMPTVATANQYGLVQPFIVNLEHGCGGGRRAYSIHEPMRTVTTVDAWGLVQPFLVGIGGPRGARGPRGLDEPLRTVLATNHQALVQPFLVKYYSGGNGAVSVDEPLPTVTTDDRFALVQPLVFQLGEQLFMLDILFRMLEPHELAAAQGFKADYHFQGNRRDVLKQIGNAVPRRLARALCRSVLS
jgi:DNA (cytosine-5)-methyltransferase 1